MPKIKNAIILAAGLGSRLKDKTTHMPKGFLQLGKYPIIEESIIKLLASGVSKIYIGTGHADDYYKSLEKKYSPFIECRRNDEYATTGSMSTLALFSDLDEDTLLLESDLIYEKKALEILHLHQGGSVILASGKTNSNDEVYIEANKTQLVAMSKKAEELNHISGELVGISKISGHHIASICQLLEQQLKNEPGNKVDYETTLVRLAADHPVIVEIEENLAWAEIDDESHLARAREKIYPLIMAKDRQFTPQRAILLNPGPATTTETVKRAQVVTDICPREIEFGELMQNVQTRLTNFVANTSDYTTVMFGGSGTAAVEAAITSITGNQKLLVIDNGAYGRRIGQIAQVFKIPHYQHTASPVEPLDYKEIEQIIEQEKPGYIAIVHNETTTGLLNDLAPLAELKRKYNFGIIVDAMSSYGAIPIEMQALDLDFVISSSNKNVQGMAGIGFVICNRASLEKIKDNVKRSFYLDLYGQHLYFEKSGQLRFTPPVQTFYALNQATIELQAETVQKRHQRYSESWQSLVTEMKKLGYDHLVAREHHSKIITAFKEPELAGYDFDSMHDYLFLRGLTIYPGKLDDLGTFRISNIGDISTQDILTFISGFKEYMSSLKS